MGTWLGKRRPLCRKKIYRWTQPPTQHVLGKQGGITHHPCPIDNLPSSPRSLCTETLSAGHEPLFLLNLEPSDTESMHQPKTENTSSGLVGPWLQGQDRTLTPGGERGRAEAGCFRGTRGEPGADLLRLGSSEPHLGSGQGLQIVLRTQTEPGGGSLYKLCCVPGQVHMARQTSQHPLSS